MKRIYKTVSVSQDTEGGGFIVALDERQVRTPAKNLLCVPTRALADTIAGEWEAQGDTVAPQTMPFTQLASTALDRIAPRRDGVVDEIVAYGGSDQLCYFADEPEDLTARQRNVWQPLLDWAAKDLGAPLTSTTGIVHVKQSTDVMATLRKVVDTEFSNFGLAALHNITGGLGSLVLALAVSRGRLTPKQAFDASRVDETFQIEKWGEDEDAKEHAQRLERDLDVADLFLKSLVPAP